jgi:hypothetical protein
MGTRARGAIASERTIAGALLVLGSVLFYAAVVLIGSITDQSGRSIVSITDEARLPVIAANTGRWELGWAFGIAGIVGTSLGLVMLEALLRAVGDRVFARLGVTAFLFGAVLTIAARAREVSVTLWAAQQTATGAPIPALLAPTGDWANAMTAIYTALAFAIPANSRGEVQGRHGPSSPVKRLIAPAGRTSATAGRATESRVIACQG